MPSGRRCNHGNTAHGSSQYAIDLSRFIYQNTTITDPIGLDRAPKTAENACVPVVKGKRRYSSEGNTHNDTPLDASPRIATLRIPYYLFSTRALKRLGIQTSSRDSKFRLGYNPWQGLGLRKPEPETVREIHKRLSNYHKQFNFGSFVTPDHDASKCVVTVDAVIQVMLAQNAGNENAIDTHSRLRNTFTYAVNGRKFAGKTPNWHEVRHVHIEELQRVLEPTGYYQKRAASIMAILNAVHDMNIIRKSYGLQRYEHNGNPPDATDFVDGMLSMAYITDHEDTCTNAILDRLMVLPSIGPKSAMCIAAFQLKRPLFVVDTHVLRYTKWLGWIPKTCNDTNLAAMYLHHIVPQELRYDLHNQIWTHCAKENSSESRGRNIICPFCGANPPSRSRLQHYGNMVCPIAEYLPPLDKRWPKRTWQDVNRLGNSTLRSLTLPLDLLPRTKTEMSKYSSKACEPFKPAEEHIETTTTGRQVSRYRRTMDINELTPAQAESEGYLLWMFRPLDNSFGMDWGTFEDLPRFKWERPTIMDPDVAVTYDYASNVLAGRAKHPWFKNARTTSYNFLFQNQIT